MTLSPTSSHGTGSSSGSGTVLFDYEVTGSVKSSIDTNVDGVFASLFSGSYKVLQAFFYARSDEAATTSSLDVIFNNDTGAKYDRQTLTAANAAVSSGSVVAQAALNGSVNGANSGASMFSSHVLTVFNYAGTVGNKSALLGAGSPQTVAGAQLYIPQLWNFRSTSAVTRLKFSCTTGGVSFAIGTRLTIFGM